jgi:hypothetical protein
MNINSRPKFSWRAFTSLYIALSFIVMIISGVVLYIAPPGRIAKWTYIPILGLEKDQWQALHTIFTFLFIIANGFHLYFNWNSFISYLKDKKKQVFRLRKELISAFLITIGIFYLVLLNVQPFRGIIDFGEASKLTWSNDRAEPPVPHAEEMTIDELADVMSENSAQLITRLKSQGIAADKNSDIKKLAEENDMSPQQIFEKLKLNKKSEDSHKGAKRGYGRMSVVQICADKNIQVEKALSRLKAAGIDATSESTLRDLGKAGNKSPNDIVKIIEGISE